MAQSVPGLDQGREGLKPLEPLCPGSVREDPGCLSTSDYGLES